MQNLQSSGSKKDKKKTLSLTSLKLYIVERIKHNVDNFPTNSQFLQQYFALNYSPCVPDLINPANIVEQENFKIIKYKDCVFFGLIEGQIKNGQGVILYKDGRVYEGEFSHDQPHGQGFQYFPNGEMYLGNFSNAKYSKFGQFLYEDGSIYEGDWMQAKRHGHGVWKHEQQAYSGDWKQGQIDGYGTMIFDNQDRYEGDFVNGKKEGNGCLVYSNGDKYIGSWKNNLFHGSGTYYWSNGATYVGSFHNGLRHGQGIMTKEEEIYQGQFQNDCKHGVGEYKWAEGWYKGEFKQDKRDGQGAIFFQGKVYEGQWVKGKLQTSEIIIEENEEGNYNIQKIEQPDLVTVKSTKKKQRSSSVANQNRKESNLKKQIIINEDELSQTIQEADNDGKNELKKTLFPIISKKEEKILKQLLISSLGCSLEKSSPGQKGSKKKKQKSFINAYQAKQKQFKGWIPQI